MISRYLTHTVLLLFTALFATSCYTQLQTAERGTYAGYYETGQRAAPERRAPVEERADEIENVEDYELGYEDGWVDAEAFYFVDEETRDWYLEHGAALAYGHSFPHYASYLRTYNPNWFFSPYAYYTYEGDYFIVPGLRNAYTNYFGGWTPWRNIGYNHLYAYYNYRPLFFWGRLNYDYYGRLYYSPQNYGGYSANWYVFDNLTASYVRGTSDDRQNRYRSNTHMTRLAEDGISSARTEVLRNRIEHRDFERVQRDESRVNLTEKWADEYRERLERNRAARNIHLEVRRNSSNSSRSHVNRSSRSGEVNSSSTRNRSSGTNSAGSSRSRSSTSSSRGN